MKNKLKVISFPIIATLIFYYIQITDVYRTNSFAMILLNSVLLLVVLTIASMIGLEVGSEK